MTLLLHALFKLTVLFPLSSQLDQDRFQETALMNSHEILGSVKDKRHLDQLIDQHLSRRKCSMKLPC